MLVNGKIITGEFGGEQILTPLLYALWFLSDNDTVKLRPGTDCALALGWLNVIISEGLYDKDFVKNWTTGFDKLVERVEEYSPQLVADIVVS